jgi:hypothetical protein
VNYKLIAEKIEVDSSTTYRSVGEDVFFDNLNFDYKVFLFYYPAMVRNTILENKLREFGEISGNNLYVNISSLKDPKWNLISKTFNIKKTPVIIITGVNDYALNPDTPFNSYLKIDDHSLLTSTTIDLAIQLISDIYQLFLLGNTGEAINRIKTSGRKIKVLNLLEKLKTGYNEVRIFLKDKDIELEVASVKLLLKSK